MRSILLALIAVAVAAAPMNEAKAQFFPGSQDTLQGAQGFGDCNAWFCHTQAGWFFPNDTKFIPGGFNNNHLAKAGTGWGIQLDMLNAISPSLAVGFTFGYFAAQINQIVTGGGVLAPATGDIYGLPMMATAIYHRQLFNRLAVFAGVSLGLMYQSLDISAPGVGLPNDQKDLWNFVIGLRAGMTYQIMQNLNFVATYEFLNGMSTDGITGHAILLGFSLPWGGW